MANSEVFNNNPHNLQTQIYGVNSNKFMPIQTDENGNLLTKLSSADGSNGSYSIPLTAFNDLRSTTLTPVAGWTFNYNINSDYIITTLANGGTADQANSMAVLSTSTANNGSAKISTRKALRYSPGLGALVRFTAVFTDGVVNSQQIIGIGDDSDGFFFGYNGATFSILRLSNNTFNWTAQTNWNMDKMLGSGPSKIILDPTKGNVYSIEYQWLGFGVINFYLTSSANGQSILVHRIQYPNTSIVPSVYNPTLPLTAKVINSGNTSNIVLQTPAAMAFCEGDPLSTAIITRNSASSSVILTAAAAANQNVLTLMNMNTFASKTNRTRIRLDFISTSIGGAKATTFKLLRNATFGIGLTYNLINASTSVIQYSNTATTVTGGIAVLTFEIPINSGNQLLVTTLNISVIPGETLTLQATSVKDIQIDCSLSWEELW